VQKTKLAALLLSCSALAANLWAGKKPQYEVGTFERAAVMSLGSVSKTSDGGLLGQSGTRTTDQSFLASVVTTPEGEYYIDPPLATGRTILQGNSANPFKTWFMTNLHAGDKVLFAPECDKHNVCDIYVPDPDKPGQTIHVGGNFLPAAQKSNTTALCGTGKLTPEVESQVCKK
jgi:hypothetical protein